jgi:hypothetical protein
VSYPAARTGITRTARCIVAARAGETSTMTARQERKLAGSGARLVAIGAPLVVIGIVLALLLSGTALGIGVAIAVLGAIPVVVGVVLMSSAGVERHARKDRPFA